MLTINTWISISPGMDEELSKHIDLWRENGIGQPLYNLNGYLTKVRQNKIKRYRRHSAVGQQARGDLRASGSWMTNIHSDTIFKSLFTTRSCVTTFTTGYCWWPARPSIQSAFAVFAIQWQSESRLGIDLPIISWREYQCQSNRYTQWFQIWTTVPPGAFAIDDRQRIRLAKSRRWYRKKRWHKTVLPAISSVVQMLRPGALVAGY